MRLIGKRYATMTECETTLTRIRVIEMNEYLDALEEAEHAQHERNKPNGPAFKR
jgi:hypothetical protein